MQTYEYKVIPAPNRPKRIKGVKGNAARFAEVVAEAMNVLAADGWEYLRSDSLPVEEKPGLLKGRVETYHSILVFRRAVAPSEEMAGYIEDQRDTVSETPEIAVSEVVAPTAAGIAATSQSLENEPEISVSPEEFGFPEEPPLHAPESVEQVAEQVVEHAAEQVVEQTNQPFAAQPEDEVEPR